jgi:superfamily I DNA/RNA helicase
MPWWDEISGALVHNDLHRRRIRARYFRMNRGVRLSTMHRVKGLEFPVMILAGVNAKYMPLPVPGIEDDEAARADHEERERSLLFVAATRARDLLIVTGWGAPSPFLPNS